MTAPASAIQTGTATVRVVTVGRTALAGIDAALRREPTVELLRARTALAAIGEAAGRLGPDSPQRLIVIVSREAVAPGREESFADAVRRVEPGARLLAVGAGPALEGFDGSVPVPVNADALRALVSAPSAEPNQAAEFGGWDSPRSAGPSGAGAPAAVARTDAPRATAAAPTDLMAPEVALATGHDPVAAALAIVKHRHGLASAVLAGTESAGDTAGGTPVEFGGRVVARLVTEPALAGDEAASAAALVAPWVILARQQDQLRRAAFTDELTGAWNRRYFNRFLAAAIEDAAAKRHTVTLLVFDVDNFKSYNDRFGHAAGDEILVETVRLLNGSIRATDRVCRIGGDEFAVIFHDPQGPRVGGVSKPEAAGPTSPQSIGEVVRRFQRAICEHRFPKLAELAPGTLTISGGMASFPWDGRTVSQLLERADALALQSKQQGKNHVTLGPGAVQACGDGG